MQLRLTIAEIKAMLQHHDKKSSSRTRYLQIIHDHGVNYAGASDGFTALFIRLADRTAGESFAVPFSQIVDALKIASKHTGLGLSADAITLDNGTVIPVKPLSETLPDLLRLVRRNRVLTEPDASAIQLNPAYLARFPARVTLLGGEGVCVVLIEGQPDWLGLISVKRLAIESYANALTGFLPATSTEG